MVANSISVERKNRVATLYVNKPPLNLLDSHSYAELGVALGKLAEDDETRVVILTGTGEKAFCAGADVKEFTGLDRVTGFYYSARNQAVRSQLWNLPQPVIAAVNGLALGAGLVLAMLSDVRIVCEDVKFGLGEINMGIIGGVQFAMKMLPPGLARKMIYTGETITAAEAYRCGLADMIVEKEELMGVALELADKIAKKSPLAVRSAKRVAVNSYSRTLAESVAEELDALRILWGTEDKDEAVRAFLEKREPLFKGS